MRVIGAIGIMDADWQTGGQEGQATTRDSDATRSAPHIGHVRRPAAIAGIALQRRGKRTAQASVIVVAVLVALFAPWGAGAAILLGLLAASASGLVDSRVSIALGLLCIACCPLAIVGQQYGWLSQSVLVGYYAANVGLYTLSGAVGTLTTWAFYFMGIGLIGQIVRYVARQREPNGA